MSQPYNQPQTLLLGYSRLLQWFLILVHCGIALIIGLAFQWWIVGRVGLLLIVLYSFWRSYRYYLGADNPASILAVEYLLTENNISWSLYYKNNKVKNVILSPASLVSRWVVILIFHDKNQSCVYSTVIPVDRINKYQFRRLSIMVKHFN